MNRLFILVLTLAFFVKVESYAQPVYERHNYEVNQYLTRLAQKGLIVWDYNIYPLRKDHIVIALDSIALQKNKLSLLEQNELEFYLAEYKKAGKKRKLEVKGGDFSVRVIPIFSGQVMSADSTSLFKRSIGVQLFGEVSKRWGYQFSFQDISEGGKNIDTSKQGIFTGPETGYVKNSLFNNKNINYTEIRAHLTHAFNKGMISVGQDYLLWGYGQGGRLVLSDKAPTYPYIRFDLQALHWLRFNYTHAWLKSDIPDSARSYTIPGSPMGDIREVMVPKFMAQHSLDIRLMNGLNLIVGESMLYTDKLNISYFIPVMFFKAFDNYSGSNNITRGSNGQFFFQLSSLNQLRNTHLYTSLLIDEVKISKFFNKTEQRNQLGYTVGGSITDLGLSYLTLGAEYTRIRPFVYRNFLPAQSYTSASFLLGDWMGANADRFLVNAKYTPLPRLKLHIRYQYIRKGSPGTLEQQYREQPQPPFLFGTKTTWSEFFLQGYYEAKHRLYLNASIRSFNSTVQVSAGLTHGL